MVWSTLKLRGVLWKVHISFQAAWSITRFIEYNNDDVDDDNYDDEDEEEEDDEEEEEKKKLEQTKG